MCPPHPYDRIPASPNFWTQTCAHIGVLRATKFGALKGLEEEQVLRGRPRPNLKVRTCGVVLTVDWKKCRYILSVCTGQVVSELGTLAHNWSLEPQAASRDSAPGRKVRGEEPWSRIVIARQQCVRIAMWIYYFWRSGGCLSVR